MKRCQYIGCNLMIVKKGASFCTRCEIKEKNNIRRKARKQQYQLYLEG